MTIVSQRKGAVSAAEASEYAPLQGADRLVPLGPDLSTSLAGYLHANTAADGTVRCFSHSIHPMLLYCAILTPAGACVTFLLTTTLFYPPVRMYAAMQPTVHRVSCACAECMQPFKGGLSEIPP